MFIDPIVASVGRLLTVPVALNIISSSASTIYNIIDSIAKSDSTYSNEIVQFIIISDIKVKLETYTLLLSEIKESNIKTIIFCINKIHDSITDIKDELIEIDKNIKYNESLYIAKKWRSHSFKINIEKLKMYVDLLNERFITFTHSCKIIYFINNKN